MVHKEHWFFRLGKQIPGLWKRAFQYAYTSGIALGLFLVGKLLLLSFGVSLDSPGILHPILCLVGALSASLPLPTLASYYKVADIKVRVDTVLALTKGHFQQKNSGSCLYIIECCVGTCQVDENHVTPPSSMVLCSGTVKLGRTPQNQNWFLEIGSIPNRLWPWPGRCFYFRHR